MNLNQVVKLKLYPTEEQSKLMMDACNEYTRCCNKVSKYIFDNNFVLNVFTLNKLLYTTIRKNSKLKSQMTQSVLKTVSARYQTIDRQYKEKGETLAYLWYPVKFKVPQIDLVRGRDFSFVNKNDKKVLSINTLNDRIKVEYNNYYFDKYFDGTWSFGTAKLILKNKHWYIHISVSKTTNDIETNEFKHVVGIDRGLRFLITAYDEAGKTAFVSGANAMAIRKKYKEVRRELQSRNTKSSKRRLKAIGQRENRWMSDVNHRISKTLVNTYGPKTLFVLENLKRCSFESENNTKSKNEMISSWTFAEFEQYLIYKAHANDSDVIKVSSKYTSQRCPHCGSICKDNRDHQRHEYVCAQCGYHSNDDRVGAMNIQLLGTRYITGEDNPEFEKAKLM
jgi:putative transposase